jgi:hypothetical protein
MGTVACACHPSYMGSINRIVVLAASKKQETTSKITRAKRAGDMAQTGKCLPSKHEAVFKTQNELPKNHVRKLGQANHSANVLLNSKKQIKLLLSVYHT